ncbi:MAG: twin-arginine translocase TatA/TatE family subunit [Actinomycetes bacterium]|jgi:sec-independent protein translocase protein TatB
MFDVGIGEIAILAVIGLLIFGPEKLPKAAGDAARMLRNLRAMATNARQDLVDSAGIDVGDTKKTLQEFSQYHPKRLMSDLLGDDTPADPKAERGRSASPTPRFDPDAT